MVVSRIDPAAALSDAAPPATSIMSPVAGTGSKASRDDHTHPVRVQRQRVTSDALGQVTWTFAAPFSMPPAIAYMIENAADQPMIGNIIELDQYHIKVQLFQSQRLPSVLTLLTQLVNFNIFGVLAANLAGKTVHLFAAEPTT